MDPNACARDIKRLASEIIALSDRDASDAEIASLAVELAERQLALTEWLARGGFAPNWRQL